MTDILLAAHHLVKHYAGVTALSDGCLEVRSGEVLALMGANGSGKSTLGKIIAGVVAHDAGQLLLNDQEVHFASPQAAQKSGIVEVHQELSLLPNMTVAENIWLAHEPLNRLAFVRRRETHARTQKLLDLLARYIKHDEKTHKTTPTRVRVENLHTSVVQGVSFELHDGELLGLGGLRGQGQNDILLALFGALPFTGNTTLSDRQVHFTHPRQAMRAGVAYVPGDRGSEGLLPIRSILENLQLPSWQRYGVPLQLQKARQDATMMARQLNIVMSSLNSPVSSLSGGNAQKVVLGKWLLRNPQVLLLDDPTKGVDVKAKEDFYKILSELKDIGAAILFYSSDDEELLGLCDRGLVLHDGQLQAELTGARLTRSDLVAASMGTT